MNYKLTRKELRIIQETKREKENISEGEAAHEPGTEVQMTGTMQKIKPYIYFALTFLIIALAVRLFVYFTA